MDPKAHKMLEEHEGHFVVQGPEGGAFRVAKHGLSEKLRERIRLCNGGAVPMSNGGLVKPALGMPPMVKPATTTDKKKPQGMGESTEKRAEVRGYYKGGGVDPLTPEERAAAAARDAERMADPEIPGVPEPYMAGGAPTPQSSEDVLGPQTVALSPVAPPLMESIGNEISGGMQAAGGIARDLGALPPAAPTVTSDAEVAADAPRPGPGHVVPPAYTTTPGTYNSVAVAQKTRHPGAPAPTEALPGVVAPQVNADLAQYQQDAIDANTETAKAQQRDKQRQILAADAYMADRQAENDKWSARGAAIKKRNDAMQADILANKIDPNRLWNSSTAGQQGTAIIGLILGGLGSGITKGPNYANEALDRAVAMDVASQEKNLATKETAMGRFIKEGYDNETAKALALGEKKIDYAAQIERSAAQFGSESAMSAAMALAAKTREEGIAQQQEAMARGFHLANAANEARDAYRNSAQKRDTEAAQAQNFRADSEYKRAEARAKLNAGAKEFPVRLTDGRVVQAPDGEQMHFANEEISAIRNAREVLARGKALGPTLGFLTGGSADERSLKAALLAALERVQTKGVRNQGLLAEIKDKEIPNFGAWLPFAKDAQIADLEKLLKAREDSVADSFTGDTFRPLTPSTRRAGS